MVALPACSFAGAGAVAGEDAGVDAVVTIDAPVDVPVDAPVACGASIIIDDHFDNSDLATAGPSSISDGFTAVANTPAGSGTAVESGAGLEVRTSENEPLPPNHGAVSNATFGWNPAGMTVRLDVTSADPPRWNGIALALQSDRANLDRPGGALVLRVRGPNTNAFNVDMGINDTYATSLGMEPYDEAELADGFSVVWTLGPQSWSYVVQGLRVNNAIITASGGYRDTEFPANLLDATSHLGIHIQGESNDTAPRVLRVARVTLWNGLCP